MNTFKEAQLSWEPGSLRRIELDKAENGYGVTVGGMLSAPEPNGNLRYHKTFVFPDGADVACFVGMCMRRDVAPKDAATKQKGGEEVADEGP